MILLYKKNLYRVEEIEIDDKTGVQGNLLDEYYIKFKCNLYWMTETYTSIEEVKKRFEEIINLIENNKIIIMK